jgi:hypothetical protein
MKNRITSLLLIGIIFLFSSCASIVSKSSYPISINSTPSEAKIIITDKKGIEVYSGNTPATMKLKAGSGFFGKAHYQVKFEKDGYDTKTVPVHFKLDGWYFGNIVFGGLIGMLIVDPATGAMYKLDTEFLNETLIKTTASIDSQELKIFGINEIPSGWKEHLVLLDK